MQKLSTKTRALGLMTDQVQDLTPTPMTLSSVMFYTGKNPYTGDSLYVANSYEEKCQQKSYFFRGKKVENRPKNSTFEQKKRR